MSLKPFALIAPDACVVTCGYRLHSEIISRSHLLIRHCEGLVLCVMEGTEPSKDEWIQSRRQCTDNYVLFVSVEVVIADGRYDMCFHVVCMVLDQVEVCYTL